MRKEHDPDAALGKVLELLNRINAHNSSRGTERQRR
mgnify:CR=1 FL=1